MPRRVKLTLTYDGTRFFGWQIQPAQRTVQGVLETAFQGLFGEKSTVVGSGRTDTRVHALGQVAHADITSSISEKALVRALNRQLPEDVRVLDVAVVPDTFHARYDARRRCYVYLLRAGTAPSPFLNNYCLQIPSPLNLQTMDAAAKMLVGTRDLSVFRSTGGAQTLPTRTIFESGIIPLSSGLTGYRIIADAFLRKMVRAIIGTLLRIGRGRATPLLMQELLNSGNRSRVGTIAPPQGLYLTHVSYEKEAVSDAEFSPENPPHE